MTDSTSKFAEILRSHKDAGNAEPEPQTKRGRPGGKGKRLNPDYAQVTAYIRRTVHEQTKINLIRQDNREFSDLVEKLLIEWNTAQANRQ